MPLESLDETFVIELDLRRDVGMGTKGTEKVLDYLHDVSRTLNTKPVREPEADLCEAYGLSGWLPIEYNEEPGACHVYAWDKKGRKRKTDTAFISIDIATPRVLSANVKQQLLDRAFKHFSGIENRIVHKTSNDPLAETWRELADNIIRQRAKIAAILRGPISKERIDQYMKDLAPQLRMQRINKPIVIYDDETKLGSGWEHWETSGVITQWNNKKMSFGVDIYTCKDFGVGYAIDFTKGQMTEIHHTTVREF